MKTTTYNHQIALSLLKGIGPKKARLLLAKSPTIESIFEDSLKRLHERTGIGPAVLKEMDRKNALEKSIEFNDYFQRNGISTHFYTDTTFPERLKQCSDAPILLYGKGEMNMNPPKVVAVVGTRNATEYGRTICEELIEGFAGKNILVVSGMAYGIDICIHQLCVRHNVQTIGVLGHGLDRIYPGVHKATAEKMLENGGLISEFLPGTKPDRENFPMRNRIVAGMTDATIVVESKASGGSLITAELANDYNRDVFAYPGNVGQKYSQGCNHLIAKQKAHLITNSDDFLHLMQWKNEKQKAIQTSLFHPLSETEKLVLEQLSVGEMVHIDVLTMKSKLPVSEVNVSLFHLEMSGMVKSLPGRMYKIT